MSKSSVALTAASTLYRGKGSPSGALAVTFDLYKSGMSVAGLRAAQKEAGTWQGLRTIRRLVAAGHLSVTPVRASKPRSKAAKPVAAPAE